MNSYIARDRRTWTTVGLQDFGDFADYVSYCNQSEYGDGQLEGRWYYCDDESRTIYYGSFGNYNSPGADDYTNADVYADDDCDEDDDHYRLAVKRWEKQPEYVSDGEWGLEDDDMEAD